MARTSLNLKRLPPSVISWLIVTLVVTVILLALVASKNFSVFRSPLSNIGDAQAAATPTPYDFRYRYDQRRTGFSTASDITTRPSLMWKFKCPTGHVNQAPPSVSNNAVFVFCNGDINIIGDTPTTDRGEGIYAFNINTGQQLWRIRGQNQPYCNGESSFAPSRMEQVGGTLYTYACRNVVAINIADGSFRWPPKKFKQYHQAIVFSAPVAATDRIYYSSSNANANLGLESYVSAINITNGAFIWEYIDTSVTFQDVITGLDFSRVVIGGGSASSVFPNPGKVNVLNNGTGSTTPLPRWSAPRTFIGPLPYQMYGPVALANGSVYVGDNTGKVRALNRDTGVSMWPVPTGSQPDPGGGGYFQAAGAQFSKAVSQHVTVGKKLVVFTDAGGRLYAVDNDTSSSGYGRLKWSTTIGGQYGTLTPSVSMTNNTIYVGNRDGEIKAFKVSDGSLRWPLPIAGTVGTPDQCTGPGGANEEVWEVVIAPGGRLLAQNDCGLLRVYGPGGQSSTGGATAPATGSLPTATPTPGAATSTPTPTPTSTPLPSVTPPPGGAISHLQTMTGGSSGSATVTSGSVTGASGNIYLASVAVRPNATVSSVSGLGLTWTRIVGQCSGRGATRVETWRGSGTPVTGTVTATFSSAVTNAAIAVSRYSGSSLVLDPFGINSMGAGGACAGGTDTASYSYTVNTSNSRFVYTAIALRNRTNSPGNGFVERAEILQGSGGDVAGLAVIDRAATGTSTLVTGSFGSTVDWAAATAEVQ